MIQFKNQDVTYLADEYYHLLGGKEDQFPEETRDRLRRFGEELQVKRDYSKFTSFKSDNDEMVIFNQIKIFSFCEHHLLPYFGYCSIGYIPNGKILGASKFQRLVDKIASRPSVQETLTTEISDKLIEILEPKGLGLVMNCTHSCMFGRGINTSTITMRTQVLKGVMKSQPETRAEFFKGVTNESLLR